MQGALAAACSALGANGAVELVFNLQQAGAQLVVVATGVANTQLLIRRVWLSQRLMQGVCIAFQSVVADLDLRLRIALVAQAPHAQRSGIRQMQRLLCRIERLQAVFTPFYKAAAQCWRSTKQIQQHKGIATEVANQREIFFAAHTRHGPVVVNAGDGLHAAAVAVAQPHAVHTLGTPGMR